LKPSDGQSFHDEVPFKVEDGAISLPAAKTTTSVNDPKDAVWYLSKMTPQPIGPWLQTGETLRRRAKRVAKKDLHSLTQIFRSLRWTRHLQSARLTSLGRFLENTTSGHAVMINEPDWLTSVLLQAV